MRMRTAAAATMLALTATTLTTPTAAAAWDRDCSDFSSQRAAQLFFLNNSPGSDPHRLDADGDWVVCESNPGPYYYGKDPTPGSGGGGAESGQTQTSKVIRQDARVVKVLDGDTVRVRLASGPRRDVRVIGIDTPEVYGGTECGGPEASKSMKRMLPRGTRVRLVSDPTQQVKDRYGRLLRYIHKGTTDVGRRQVFRGHAEVYVYNNKPFQRTKLYRSVQAAAKRAGSGIWGSCR